MSQETEKDVCAYADDALEHYMKECFRLKEENRELKEQIKRLLWMIEVKD